MPDLVHAWPIEAINGIQQVLKHLNASDTIFIIFCILNGINVVFLENEPSVVCPIV